MKLNEIYMRDPFVFVEEDVAYLIGTTDENAWAGQAKGFKGYKSYDLVNFEGPYTLFEANDSFWANENFWAPELHKYNGKYYIFASFKKEGKSRASQVLVSDSPLGKYVPSSKPFTPRNWECLDATLFEDNGKFYTVFCHEWTDCIDGEMMVSEIKPPFENLLEEPKKLFKASEAEWTVPFNDGCYVTDGPFLKRLSNGKLFMLWSSIGKDGYAMGMAVSDNDIYGKWNHIKEPLFTKDGGHGMIFEFKGKSYISLHCPNQPHMEERPVFYEVEEDGDKLVLKDKETL